MGISVWVEVEASSFYRALRRFEYEGLPSAPLSLLNTCARVVAREVDQNPSSQDLTRWASKGPLGLFCLPAGLLELPPSLRRRWGRPTRPNFATHQASPALLASRGDLRQRLVTHGVFEVGHYPQLPVPSKQELVVMRRAAIERR